MIDETNASEDAGQQEEPTQDKTSSLSMAQFVQQHRNARLPSIQRRNELLARERAALGGEDQQNY